MKQIKIWVILIFLAATIFTVVSYTLFVIHKASVEKSLTVDKQLVIIQTQALMHDESEKNSVQHDLQYHTNNTLNFEDVDHDQPVTLMIPEPARPRSTTQVVDPSGLVAEDIPRYDNPEEYSFVNMPLRFFTRSGSTNVHTHAMHEYVQLDPDVKDSFDVLIGNDFNHFITVVLQSNNDIVSEQACRSCGLYALFKKVKHHKDLTLQEVKTLQHIIDNLYRFVERMKEFSKHSIFNAEQYSALQELHRPQAIKNQMRLQARKAMTEAALRKLQAIRYNK